MFCAERWVKVCCCMYRGSIDTITSINTTFLITINVSILDYSWWTPYPPFLVESLLLTNGEITIIVEGYAVTIYFAQVSYLPYFLSFNLKTRTSKSLHASLHSTSVHNTIVIIFYQIVSFWMSVFQPCCYSALLGYRYSKQLLVVACHLASKQGFWLDYRKMDRLITDLDSCFQNKSWMS